MGLLQQHGSADHLVRFRPVGTGKPVSLTLLLKPVLLIPKPEIGNQGKHTIFQSISFWNRSVSPNRGRRRTSDPATRHAFALDLRLANDQTGLIPHRAKDAVRNL